MPVAALYDIHANLPALEAVLDEVRELDLDQIVVGGDVFPGPMPRETLTALQELKIPVLFLYGNGEVAVLAAAVSGETPLKIPEHHRQSLRWTANQLGADDRAFIASWPATVHSEIGGLGDVLFCHATPRDENEMFTRLTPETQLLPIFESLGVDLVVCGHTHMQFARLIGETRVVNAGSVGMPFGRSGSDWLLLGPGVQFRHTDYDLEEAAHRVRATSFPDAETFASKNILHPPGEAEMLAVFERAAAVTPVLRAGSR